MDKGIFTAKSETRLIEVPMSLMEIVEEVGMTENVKAVQTWSYWRLSKNLMDVAINYEELTKWINHGFGRDGYNESTCMVDVAKYFEFSKSLVENGHVDFWQRW